MIPGYGIDDGTPTEGVRYGGANTIHNTGNIDIVIEKGEVVEVWFRCKELAFKVHDYDNGTTYDGGHGDRIVAVEVAA